MAPGVHPGDQEVAWQIYSGLHRSLLSAGRSDFALEMAQQAFEDLLGASTQQQQAALYGRLGQLRSIADPPAGLELLSASLRICEDLPLSAEQLLAVLHTEGVQRHLGRISDAEGLNDRALEMARRLGDFDAQVRVVSMQAWHRMAAGEPEAASRLLAEMNVLLARARLPSTVIDAASTRTDILLKLGRLEEVPPVVEEALQLAVSRGLGDAFVAWALRWNLYDALTERGLTSRAIAVMAPIQAVPLTPAAEPGHAAWATLTMLTGDLAKSERQWHDYADIEPASVEYRVENAVRRGELALWMHRPAAAFSHSLALLREASSTDDSALCGSLLVIAARACADAAEHARAAQNRAALQDCDGWASDLMAVHAAMTVDPLHAGPMRVNADANRLQWNAELSRAAGDSKPEAWDTATAAWLELSRPHRAAYTMLRHAEALLSQRGRSAAVGGLLRTAADLASEHIPLHRAITEVATRVRVHLSPPIPTDSAPMPAAVPNTDPYGLTPRELAVLRLLTEGKSNVEIGRALFMSPRTASVHVSRILRKLGVQTRTHAATIAQRAGMLE
jgi:DNA-binding CsgD family transcriptional regulator/tetratricopeptide (TPR) repeat protein